ncbi:uncharacterized protein LOC124356950 isoform X4 [Homalodisca vitripennis]|uniref:uncharacterized protein LOC124356950 isoform X4 n=1 Tax=Homalodisca vitripennis TaxID=197043 RepID=UPI001EECD2E8|nr:uncharacterized protein LOC124356950 isoform X4 [Homalodisca vitripennis]
MFISLIIETLLGIAYILNETEGVIRDELTPLRDALIDAHLLLNIFHINKDMYKRASNYKYRFYYKGNRMICPIIRKSIVS